MPLRYQSLLSRKGYQYEDHINFLIDLGQTEETLWSRLNKSGRNRIRTAGKKGLRIQEASGVEAVESAYLQLEQVYARIGVPPRIVLCFRRHRKFSRRVECSKSFSPL